MRKFYLHFFSVKKSILQLIDRNSALFMKLRGKLYKISVVAITGTFLSTKCKLKIIGYILLWKIYKQ